MNRTTPFNWELLINITSITAVNRTTSTVAKGESSTPLHVWIIITLITMIFGVFANLLLLLTLFIHRPLRQSSSWTLITHTSFLNLYLTAITVPVNTIPVYLGPAHRLPPAFCRNQVLPVYSVYGISVWAETFLALHRLAATVSPQCFTMVTKRSVTVAMIILSWIFGVSLFVFPAAEVGVHWSTIR